MLPLDAFLTRARQLLGAAAASKSEIITTIESVCGAKLATTMIEVRGKEVIITAHPAIKNTLFIKKAAIIETLKKKGVDIITLR